MDHEIPIPSSGTTRSAGSDISGHSGSSVLGRVRCWFRGRSVRPAEDDAPPSAETTLTSTGRLCPTEDETSGEFAERVARIKADVLRRALAALASDES